MAQIGQIGDLAGGNLELFLPKAHQQIDAFDIETGREKPDLAIIAMGDEFMVPDPAGSGHAANLWQVTSDLSRRLITLFTRDASGRRPAHGRYEKFQTDPHWKDLILFYEYFHGDSGAGLGASHQTGWTGLVAKLIHQHAEYTLRNNAHQASEEWHFEGKPEAP